MRPVSELIAAVRENTGTDQDVPGPGAASGLSTSLILRALNQAHQSLYAAIVAEYPNVFLATAVVPVAAKQALVPLSTMPAAWPIYAGERVTRVRWREREGDEWRHLRPGDDQAERNVFGTPHTVYRRSGSLVLSPAPERACQVEVQYVRECPSLVETPYATVASVVGNVVTLTVTGNAAYSAAGRDTFAVYRAPEFRESAFWRTPQFTWTTPHSVATFAADSPPTGVVVGDAVVPTANVTPYTWLGVLADAYLIEYAENKVQRRFVGADAQESLEAMGRAAEEVVRMYRPADELIVAPHLDPDLVVTAW